MDIYNNNNSDKIHNKLIFDMRFFEKNENSVQDKKKERKCFDRNLRIIHINQMDVCLKAEEAKKYILTYIIYESKYEIITE
ncbi:hypothetical protein DERP_011754 [Dermatophagoides pteronyssinus]|uniref:Uncharacterized protein n=1 Tax=Dermatophagoides pteronyssinus TaxID=6956 RepID=A0ABQ8J3F1_DERPT|nr:hypothetical protein DERP_011754 [Dermatophagoides pteronyssinus]